MYFLSYKKVKEVTFSPYHHHKQSLIPLIWVQLKDIYLKTPKMKVVFHKILRKDVNRDTVLNPYMTRTHPTYRKCWYVGYVSVLETAVKRNP